MDFLQHIEHWHSWLILAFVILIVELMSGTYFLLALAGGAFLTTAATWLQAPSITVQVIVFAASSAITYMVLLSFRKKEAQKFTDGTTHMIGQHVKVIETVEHEGRVDYKGVLWQAKADTVIAANAYAEIVAVLGSTLVVKPVVLKTDLDGDNKK